MLREQKSKHRKVSRRKRLRHRKYWRSIIAKRYERILVVARHFTRNHSDAWDLAQTVVLRLLKYCPRPVRIINLDAYIFTSVRNAWLDSQRPNEEISFADLKSTDPPQVVDLDPNLEHVFEVCNVKALMKKSAPNDLGLLRTIILRQEGYSLPEIAKILGEPVRRTRARWYRHRECQRRTLLALHGKNLVSTKVQ